MRRNRRFTFTVEKPNETDPQTETIIDDRPIEDKAEAILHKLEKVGIKIFAGVCIYVLLDTHRRVAVEKASHPKH